MLIIIIELEERREIKNEKGRKAKAIYHSLSNLRQGAMLVFMLGTFFQTPSWCIFSDEAHVKLIKMKIIKNNSRMVAQEQINMVNQYLYQEYHILIL